VKLLENINKSEIPQRSEISLDTGSKKSSPCGSGMHIAHLCFVCSFFRHPCHCTSCLAVALVIGMQCGFLPLVALELNALLKCLGGVIIERCDVMGVPR